ncbi:MAG: hypothetical protein ACK4NA_13580 [Alphaproteobacteria bacterium]
MNRRATESRRGIACRWRGAALATALAFLGGAAAEAQLLKPNLYPAPRESLRLFEMLRPLDAPETLHSWSLSAGYQMSDLDSKTPGQRDRRTLHTGLASLNARVGARGFAGLDLSYSGQDIDLLNRAMPIRANVEERGLRLNGGAMVLPYLAVGATVGRSSLNGTYHFGVSPEDPSSGEIMSYGGFAALLYPAGDWKFSLTGAYSYDEGRQSFADGVPREQRSHLHVATTVFTALYSFAPRLDGVASLAWHHMIDERTVIPGRVSDEDWLRPTLGLVWRASERTSLLLFASSYALNEAYDYAGLSAGLNYKF